MANSTTSEDRVFFTGWAILWTFAMYTSKSADGAWCALCLATLGWLAAVHSWVKPET